MFFPTQRNLPRPGDAVIFRPYSRPYTVTDRSSRDGYVWLSLDGHPEPVIVEAMNWAPLPGCRVEVLYQPYVSWLEGVARDYLRQAGMSTGDERHRHIHTVERIRKRQQKGINYRVGTLIQVDGEWCKVQFTNEDEVMPLCCVAVVEKPRTTKQLELAS